MKSKAARVRSESLRAMDARNVCIIKPSALGDVVQALPILGAIRQRFPRARVSWVIASHLTDLLEGHAGIDQLLCYPRRGTWSDAVRLLRNLHQQRFDLTIDLQGLLRSGIMTLATRAANRVGLEAAREGAHLACNLIVPGTSRDVPAWRRYSRVAEVMGAGNATGQVGLPIGVEAFRWIDRQIGDRQLLTINPASRWVTKNWPVEKFAAVASRVASEFGCVIAITGSNNEADVAGRLQRILSARGVNDVRNFAGKTTLKQLAAILSRSDCVLTNDSGPMHIAAALGTPVTAIFTCTSPRISGPPGDQHELIAADVECAGSYKKQCPLAEDRRMCCFAAVSVEQVWRAVRRILERRQLASA